jgi:hypothetical protein
LSHLSFIRHQDVIIPITRYYYTEIPIKYIYFQVKISYYGPNNTDIGLIKTYYQGRNNRISILITPIPFISIHYPGEVLGSDKTMLESTSLSTIE